MLAFTWFNDYRQVTTCKYLTLIEPTRLCIPACCFMYTSYPHVQLHTPLIPISDMILQSSKMSMWWSSSVLGFWWLSFVAMDLGVWHSTCLWLPSLSNGTLSPVECLVSLDKHSRITVAGFLSVLRGRFYYMCINIETVVTVAIKFYWGLIFTCTSGSFALGVSSQLNINSVVVVMCKLR